MIGKTVAGGILVFPAYFAPQTYLSQNRLARQKPPPLARIGPGQTELAASR